jgi:thiamine-monophosphate kinase
MALNGGEDYELLFTGSPENVAEVQKQADGPVTVIGEITAEHPGEVSVVDNNGVPVEISKGGWEHFISR